MVVNCKRSFGGWIIAVICTQLLLSGAVNFNLKTHICCNGTVAEQGETTSCCGNQAFNSTGAVCCGHNVVFFKDSPMDILFHGCCYDQSGDAKPFDTRTHECCDGTPLQKPDKDTAYSCCSGKLFNTTSHICCGGKIQDLSAGRDCCGNKSYNSSSQICCEQWGLVEDKLALEYSDILDRKGPTSLCCERVAYDPTTEVCCHGKVLIKPPGIAPTDAGCCQGQVMDHNSQLCCRSFKNSTGDALAKDGSLYNKTGAGSTCCGAEVMDFHEEVCCDETRLPKPKGMDRETLGSCCGGQAMTSFEFQLCDNGKLVERSGFDMWTCGDNSTLFNTTTHNCCFGQVLENSSDQGCCYLASKPYNKKTENCCGPDIVQLTEEDIHGQKFACCAPFTDNVAQVAGTKH